jgi:DNA-binding transcriptional ArsR family regulator
VRVTRVVAGGQYWNAEAPDVAHPEHFRPRRVPKRARRRQDSPLARAQACPKGHRIARSQTGWLADVREHPELLLLRGDAQAHVMAVAGVLAAFASWETHTTRPTWAVLCERTGLSRRTVARHLAWLRGHGLLAIVEHGTTPALSPGVLTVGPDGEAHNVASVYLLIAPEHLRLVATTHPDDVGAEYVQTGPVDAIEAAAEDVEAGTAPPPLLASLPSLAPRSTPLDRSAPYPARWTVDVSGTPSPPGGGLSPHTRAREIRNLGDLELRRSDPAWPSSKRPTAKDERAAAALEARRLTPDLARLSTPYVAALFREWHLAGWTLGDILVALNRAPDGPAAAGHRHTNAVRHVPAWVRTRLAAWRADPLDPTSPPGASPSARAAADRAHQAAVLRAARERDARQRGLAADELEQPARNRHDVVDPAVREATARHASAVREALRAARRRPVDD